MSREKIRQIQRDLFAKLRESPEGRQFITDLLKDCVLSRPDQVYDRVWRAGRYETRGAAKHIKQAYHDAGKAIEAAAGSGTVSVMKPDPDGDPAQDLLNKLPDLTVPCDVSVVDDLDREQFKKHLIEQYDYDIDDDCRPKGVYRGDEE